MTRRRKPSERKDRSKSLRQAVLRAVSKLGECTVAQIAAEVGWLIDASRAWREYHRRSKWDKDRGRHYYTNCTQDEKLIQGKRWVVGMTLSGLLRDGRVARIRRGVYTQVPPKIYVPDVG